MKQTVEFPIELEGIFYNAVCVIDFHIDHNYGADADGNRGSARRFVEDVHIIQLYNHVDGFFFDAIADLGGRFDDLIKSKAEEYL